MSFEKVFDKHKEDLTQALLLFGEGVRVNKILVAEEMKRPEYYKFYEEGYEAGQRSKKQEIDNLKSKIEEVLDLIQGDSLGDYAVLGDFRRDIEYILK